MKRIPTLVLIAVATLLAACNPPTVPPPAPQPGGAERYLVDPRVGVPPAPRNLDTKFDLAWRYIVTDNRLEATKALLAIVRRNPDYLPAQLAPVVFLLRDRQLDRARLLVDSLLDKHPRYTAARVYRAEIAVAAGETQRAYDLYRALAAEPEAPELVRERILELRRAIFDGLVANAHATTDTEAIHLLRAALDIDPAAVPVRIELVQKLVAARAFDDARKALDPLLAGADADRTEVQAALAEIEIGHGRYQEAIVRYERIVRRDARYASRLDQIKEDYAAANMPLQVQRALETESINRADLAVLMYWKIVSIRFATNVPSPPIAVDVDVLGRDELVRAIALGLYVVDPVTRRVGSGTTVNSTSLTRIAARVLLLRGANCSRQATGESSDLGRAQRVLAACNVADPMLTLGADVPVSGRAAAKVAEEIDRALR